ncbi:MAG: hypothetical protein WCF67_04900 [Chitinophagaceae bacterium]
MKALLMSLCIALLLQTKLAAQAPQQFNYQAVARNNSGAPLANQAIRLRLSVHHNSSSGPVQYSETRNITTSASGLFTVAIGSSGAMSTAGSVGSTYWQSGDKYLQVEIDAGGGNNFTDMGTTQLLSVPYALSSKDNRWDANGNSISNNNAGNVGIGTNTPDASAMLDVTSSSKGLLVPRLTAVQRNALALPAKGLLVYQIELPEGFYYNAGTTATPDWILLGATGPQGPQGVQGPAGATGIVKGYTTAGTVAYPTSTLSFITPTVTITVTPGQKVFMTASRALGAYVDVSMADALGIYPAYQSTEPGSPIVNLSLGMFGLRVRANTRATFSVNGIFENLPAGTYRFGMSGQATTAIWTNSEWGYVSALVY